MAHLQWYADDKRNGSPAECFTKATAHQKQHPRADDSTAHACAPAAAWIWLDGTPAAVEYDFSTANSDPAGVFKYCTWQRDWDWQHSVRLAHVSDWRT